MKRFLNLLWFLIPAAVVAAVLPFSRNVWFPGLPRPRFGLPLPLLPPLLLAAAIGAALLFVRFLLQKRTGVAWPVPAYYLCLFVVVTACVLPKVTVLLGLPLSAYSAETIRLHPENIRLIVTPPAVLESVLIALIVCFLVCLGELTLLSPIKKRMAARRRKQ